MSMNRRGFFSRLPVVAWLSTQVKPFERKACVPAGKAEQRPVPDFWCQTTCCKRYRSLEYMEALDMWCGAMPTGRQAVPAGRQVTTTGSEA